MNIRCAILTAILLSMPAGGEAQTISPGLSIGAPLNRLVTATGDLTDGTGRSTFGPSLRIGLPRRFAVDVDLLYKRFNFGFASGPGRVTAHRLELPLMVRYGFSGLPFHPFVHAGMSFNRIIAVNGAGVCERTVLGEEVYCIGDAPVAVLRHRHTYGPVLGIGAEFRWSRLEVSPELRITRWVDRNFGTQDSQLRSNLTGIDLLCSLRF